MADLEITVSPSLDRNTLLIRMALNTLWVPGQPSNHCEAQALLQPSGSQVGLEFKVSPRLFLKAYMPWAAWMLCADQDNLELTVAHRLPLQSLSCTGDLISLCGPGHLSRKAFKTLYGPGSFGQTMKLWWPWSLFIYMCKGCNISCLIG
jgi:hypothetical protein